MSEKIAPRNATITYHCHRHRPRSEPHKRPTDSDPAATDTQVAWPLYTAWRWAGASKQRLVSDSLCEFDDAAPCVSAMSARFVCGRHRSQLSACPASVGARTSDQRPSRQRADPAGANDQCIGMALNRQTTRFKRSDGSPKAHLPINPHTRAEHVRRFTHVPI